MKLPVLFLLATVLLSGCLIFDDSPSPLENAEVLHYRKLFEAGRRSESMGDVRIAEDTYGWLIGRDNRYGEYGLAMLLLRRDNGSREAIKLLLSCAQRTSNVSSLHRASVEEAAFSVAAMAKLSDIAVSIHDRLDVAASLRGKMSGIVTPEVKAWAEGMRADADSATIYRDVISAVESCRKSREYVKDFKWIEIVKVFLKGESGRE